MHVYDYEPSSEDLELILQLVGSLTAFAHIDRHGSNVTRYLDDTLRRYAGGSLKELELQSLPNTLIRSQDIRINLWISANRQKITCEAL